MNNSVDNSVLYKDDKKVFTFTWAIENFDMCPQTADSAIVSPTFMVNSLGGRSFQLRLYPRGHGNSSYLSLYAACKPNKMEHSVTVESTFKIRTADQSVFKPFRRPKQKLDNKNSEVVWGVKRFQRREIMFEQKNIYLPSNALILQFEIWKDGGNASPSQYAGTFADVELENQSGIIGAVSTQKPTSEDWNEAHCLNTYSNECFARTRVGVRKCSVLWPIFIDFTLSSNCSLLKPVYFAGDADPSFHLAFYLSGGSGEEQRANIDIRYKSMRDAPPAFLKSTITVVDPQKTAFYSKLETEHFCKPTDKEQVFEFCTLNVMETNYLDLTQYVMYLYFQIALSTEADYNVLHFKDLLMSSNKKLRVNVEAFNSAIGSDLKRARKDDKFKDVMLRSGDQEYPANKIVLSARSRVFCAMFDSDMQEKNSGVVDITDVDPDTLSRMLDYLYSDQLGDLSPAHTISLYRAADKYEIVSLKSRCAGVLKTFLSVSSLCDILQLSDTHQDGDLMDFVRNFIHLHRDEVFCSPEWQNWAPSNSKLAADIMIKEWIKKMYQI